MVFKGKSYRHTADKLPQANTDRTYQEPSQPAKLNFPHNRSHPFNVQEIQVLQRALGNKATLQLVTGMSKASTFTTNQPVIQRIEFISSKGKKVNVTEEQIIEKLHSWMYDVMKNDKDKPVYDVTEWIGVDGEVNWNKVQEGGLKRPAEDIADYYSVAKETKSKGGYLYNLQHDSSDSSRMSQIGSSMLPKVKENNSRALMDGLVKPSSKIDTDLMGEGVSYKEIKDSWEMIKEKKVIKTSTKKSAKTIVVHDDLTDQELAIAHLELLQGNKPANFTEDEILKMHYHLAVMMVAETRRDSGMFPFGPITLQNIADGKITGEEAFTGETEEYTDTNGKKKTRKKENKKGFPAAFEGSKNPLETMEEKLGEKGESMSSLSSAAAFLSVKNRMKTQLSTFFDDNRRDFRHNKKILGANFTDSDGALDAIVNLLKEKYFSLIPAMHDPATDIAFPERAEKRKLLDRRVETANVISETFKTTTSFGSTETMKAFTEGIPENADNALAFTTGPKKKRKHSKSSHRLSRDFELELRNQEPFSDSDSEEETEKKQKKLLQEREKNKRRKKRGYTEGLMEAEKEDKMDISSMSDEEEKRAYEQGWEEGGIKLYSEGFIDGFRNEINKKRKQYLSGNAKGTELRKQFIANIKKLLKEKGKDELVKNAHQYTEVIKTWIPSSLKLENRETLLMHATVLFMQEVYASK